MSNVMNKISKYILVIILIIIIAYTIIRCIPEHPIYNFVDLQIKYKRYLLVDKYVENFSNSYVFILKNPVTNQNNRVYVKDYLYTNVYFVGDTIK